MSAQLTIVGRLGADPELKFAANGTAIVKLRVVSSGRKRQDDGTWIDVDTTWWHVTAFKTLAETVANSMLKGDAVIVVGTVKGREWEDQKTGEKRTALEVLASSVGPDYARPKKNAPVGSLGRPGATPDADDPWQTTTEPPF
ncbi:MAG: single-stranded DNA-binding protein [Actinomycetes bacterium]